MDSVRAKLAFNRQKKYAKQRGIGWELTFDQWLAWWGDDLDKRGRGRDALQMQRPADTGPYAIGNIRKGTPKQNARTAACMRRKRATEDGKHRKQQYLDALMSGCSSKKARELIYGAASLTP